MQLLRWTWKRISLKTSQFRDTWKNERERERERESESKLLQKQIFDRSLLSLLRCAERVMYKSSNELLNAMYYFRAWAIYYCIIRKTCALNIIHKLLIFMVDNSVGLRNRKKCLCNTSAKFVIESDNVNKYYLSNFKFAKTQYKFLS